jgi:hypothetical protein
MTKSIDEGSSIFSWNCCRGVSLWEDVSVFFPIYNFFASIYDFLWALKNG